MLKQYTKQMRDNMPVRTPLRPCALAPPVRPDRPVQQANVDAVDQLWLQIPMHHCAAHLPSQSSRTSSPSSNSRRVPLTSLRICRPTHHLFSGCRSSLLVEVVLAGSTCLVAAGRIQAAHTVPVAGRMVLGPGRTGWVTRHSSRSEVQVSHRSKALEVDTVLVLGQRRDGLGVGIEDRQVAPRQENPGLVSHVHSARI